MRLSNSEKVNTVVLLEAYNVVVVKVYNVVVQEVCMCVRFCGCVCLGLCVCWCARTRVCCGEMDWKGVDFVQTATDDEMPQADSAVDHAGGAALIRLEPRSLHYSHPCLIFLLRFFVRARRSSHQADL